RYDIYAPWVQQVEIFGKGSLEIKNIDPFLTLLDGCPPLPNLQRLTTCATAPVGSNVLMGSINMFICPSLTEIRTVLPLDGLPEHPSSRVPSSVPTFLKKTKLKRARETCPEIRVLEFYPELASEDNGSESYTPSDQCRSTLSSFTHLHSFSGTTYVFEFATLGILGGLPHLESLGIRGSPAERPVLDRMLSIPETWFPVLKDLRIYDVHPEDIKILWNQPTIVEKLVSALIQTDRTRTRNPLDDLLYGTGWIGPFLEALPCLSSGLQDMDFFVGSEDLRVMISQNMWKFFITGATIHETMYEIADCLRTDEANSSTQSGEDIEHSSRELE
ncbi:hypothetical protein FRC11_011576, partial [Ceratobasidium sp. 423]